jgi:Flp pilus assembly pilin Flp
MPMLPSVDRTLEGDNMLRLWTACHNRAIGDEEGASMIEYAFLIALIAIVVVGAALFLGTEPGDKFSEVGDTLQAF